MWFSRHRLSQVSHRADAARSTASRRAKRKNPQARGRWQAPGLVVEFLEERTLLSASGVATPDFLIARSGAIEHLSSGGTAAAPYTPAEITTAYGVNAISFGGVAGTGAGQTIAIVDAYNDPDIISDANSFSSEFGLPQFNGSGEPTLKVLNETGGTTLPANSSPGGWDVEESLDVEWAHSIAPGANIILFEANSASYSDLLQAVTTAADYSGVSVVSMSWSGGEFSGETSYDSDFLTPSGHQGVTFLASTGDTGTPSGYPAFSPNVVAVGGTSLSIQSNGTYVSETVWDDSSGASGGGISQYESLPSYQDNLDGINGASKTHRNVPDVSMDADPDTGVFVLDSYAGGWFQVGGTSLSCPMWAGLIAIADQGRVLKGETTLNGATQTLPMLYGLPSADFHNITSGSNGTYSAGAGYNLATGIGTPVANLLVPGLVGASSSPSAPSVSAPASESTTENTAFTFSGTSAITVADSSIGSGVDTVKLSVSDGTLSLGSTSGLSSVSGNGSASVTLTGTIAKLNAALAGLIYTPKSGFSGSDALTVTITDPGDSLSASGKVTLTVTAPAAPKVTAPSSFSLTNNESVAFVNTISITDSAAGSGTEKLVLSTTHGTLALGSTTGITITSGANKSASMTLSGTLAHLNAAIDVLTFNPTSGYTGSSPISLTYTDTGNNLTGSATIAVTVAAATRATQGFGGEAGGRDVVLQLSRGATLGSESDPAPGTEGGNGETASSRADVAIGSSGQSQATPGGEALLAVSGSGNYDPQGAGPATADSDSSSGQSDQTSSDTAATLWAGLEAALAVLGG